MKDINVPGQAQALVAEYQLKGRVRLSLDETIVPVVIVSDVQDANPGQPESPGGTVINPAATVGEFGFGGVRAAPGSILRVDSIIIDDEGGGRRHTSRQVGQCGGNCGSHGYDYQYYVIGETQPSLGAWIAEQQSHRH